ncbi:hypothetical protein CBF34_05715 [Vagococcus penaei]|uniref:Uncharacterized protein n=1 Tax=Vagococcus penaei TaxID=633807 RepID=A0A1Q2D3P2_9ENTE|nr:ferredoxin [Vagococcus penaei]AQP52968.1 hypothetical protein BW732_01175 [Vagococcus penaei]RSU02572.1 hypothetical protein CBF34_05715 [Vagococcus penaei]
MLCQIIPEKCIACGLCQIKAPERFDYYDNGIVKFKETDALSLTIPGTKQTIPADILEAYRHCPTRAILLSEDTKK